MFVEREFHKMYISGSLSWKLRMTDKFKEKSSKVGLVETALATALATLLGSSCMVIELVQQSCGVLKQM